MPIFGNPFDVPHVSPGWDLHRDQHGYWMSRTVTTTTTNSQAPEVDEERVRRIVREEIAGLPISFDVPDAPEGE